MEKPISVVITELERGIGSAIENSHLHPCIIKNVLLNYLMAVQEHARQMEIQDALAWEESQKDEGDE